MIGIFQEELVLFVSLFLDDFGQRVVMLPELCQRVGARSLFSPLLAPPPKALFERSNVTCLDLLFDLLQQMSASLARSKILHHLPVPFVVLDFIEPRGQRGALIFRKLLNGLFDCFDRHNRNLT